MYKSPFLQRKAITISFEDNYKNKENVYIIIVVHIVTLWKRLTPFDKRYFNSEVFQTVFLLFFQSLRNVLNTLIGNGPTYFERKALSNFPFGKHSHNLIISKSERDW